MKTHRYSGSGRAAARRLGPGAAAVFLPLRAQLPRPPCAGRSTTARRYTRRPPPIRAFSPPGGALGGGSGSFSLARGSPLAAQWRAAVVRRAQPPPPQTGPPQCRLAAAPVQAPLSTHWPEPGAWLGRGAELATR